MHVPSNLLGTCDAATPPPPAVPRLPDCRGWQWVKGDGNTLELTLRTALQQLLVGRAEAGAAGAAEALGRRRRRAAGSARPSSGGSGGGSGGVEAPAPGGAGEQPAAPAGAAPPVILSVAGRTDRGVSALAQVASFYTWDSGMEARVRRFCFWCC